MELNKDEIVDWAVNWASYKELEDVSKALYGLYVQRRKAEKPEVHKRAKQIKKSIKLPNSVYWRHKKGQPKEEFPGMHGEVIVRKSGSS
jgi:hypothetical protein